MKKRIDKNPYIAVCNLAIVALYLFLITAVCRAGFLFSLEFPQNERLIIVGIVSWLTLKALAEIKPPQMKVP